MSRVGWSFLAWRKHPSTAGWGCAIICQQQLLPRRALMSETSPPPCHRNAGGGRVKSSGTQLLFIVRAREEIASARKCPLREPTFKQIFGYDEGVSETPLELAHRLITQAGEALRAAVDSATGDADLIAVLTLGEGARRLLDQSTVAALADLEQRGTFAERGYRSSSAALCDLLGWDRADAKRHLSAAEHIRPRTGLDATPLPPRLPATAAAFDTGAAGLRHVEVVARVLGADAAGRLDPQRWAGAEAQLAAWIPDCTPTELHARGVQLIEALDADGPEPDERPEPCVTELYLHRRRGGGGGRLVGRFDDAAMFDAIATLLDAQSAPRTADDDRTGAQRQAEALAEACGYVLEHADSTGLSSCGGRRPQLSVLIGLEDLERRARATCLDFGGTLSPESLRMLACDAAVVPVVLDGAGQPLDVGRATRTIPDGLRRAVTARDRGCARCGRPPSWCEIHHIIAWEHDGENQARQPGHAVPGVSPAGPPRRVGRAPHRRDRGVPAAGLDRPAASTPPPTAAARRPRLRSPPATPVRVQPLRDLLGLARIVGTAGRVARVAWKGHAGPASGECKKDHAAHAPAFAVERAQAVKSRGGRPST
jgi:uncharacterized protein DUF222